MNSTITTTGNAVNDSSQTISALAPSDFENLYTESQKENQRLKDVMTAARIDPNRVAIKDVKPVKSAAQIRGELGDLALLNMTSEQKLASLGISDPTVTRDLLIRIYGVGNDPSVGRNLMLTNPSRYRLLKEAAKLTGAFAARK